MPTEFVHLLRKFRAGAARQGLPLLVGWLLTALACSSPPPEQPLTWEQRLAAGRLDQAQALLEQGDLPAARRTAELSLKDAQHSAWVAGIGRSLAMLSFLREDIVSLQEAVERLRSVGDTPGLVRAQLWLAELAVRAGRADVAVPAAEEALAALPRSPSAQIDSASTEARVRHLHAAALRLSGRAADAAASERRAALLLSLLPDDQLLPLRAAVAQGCGDDLYRAGDARGALERHAQAAECAHRTGDRAAELQAIASLAIDFALAQRFNDAVDHGLRALHLARELQDVPTQRAVATRGLAALRALAEPPTSARWLDFSAALAP
jgi:tetratricopeptide (TPR) repeat protein